MCSSNGCNYYCIDHLIYRYTDNGQPADQYDVIEYPNGGVLTDTIMRYDVNGNLIKDKDRGIVAKIESLFTEIDKLTK